MSNTSWLILYFYNSIKVRHCQLTQVQLRQQSDVSKIISKWWVFYSCACPVPFYDISTGFVPLHFYGKWDEGRQAVHNFWCEIHQALPTQIHYLMCPFCILAKILSCWNSHGLLASFFFPNKNLRNYWIFQPSLHHLLYDLQIILSLTRSVLSFVFCISNIFVGNFFKIDFIWSTKWN